MNWIPYGPNAVLFRFADRVDEEAFLRGRAIANELERRPPAGMVEFVPAFTTVLLIFDPAKVPSPKVVAPALAEHLDGVRTAKLPLPKVHEIPVVYGGPDLQRVAEFHKIKPEKVCELHAARTYKVYMIGFSPGFPYLGELDERLHTPRRESPRTRVPAGSVAIGGEHTGIYTVDSPGGWNIIGHTMTAIFDPARGAAGGDEAMFLLKHGDRVQFVPEKAK